MLKSLKHNNIVNYFGCVPKGDTMWIIMEYCGGGSLADIIRETQVALNEKQCAVVLSNACQGLAFLHSKNIIHRDIKAANILLTEQGTVKLGKGSHMD